ALSTAQTRLGFTRRQARGENDSWADLRGQGLLVETERAEPGLARRVRQREHGRLVRLRIVVIAPGINVGRRNDDRRIAEVFEPVDKLERDFLEPRERKLIVVELGAIAPRDN